ncbi:hypothetical protein SEUCBS139899_001946 [Sporothrix eucalyptigena]
MPGEQIRLLALDGGGVRGLSSLMILDGLMATVDPESPPKPCEYFDMIGGTSTGGLIAVMLGRLRMTVGECIEAYTSLSDKVFEKKSYRVKINGKLQGRFDAVELGDTIKRILRARDLNEDELLKDVDASCKVKNLHLLNSATIWQACRATSAATGFFDPIAIGPFDEEFVDGALVANNPIYTLWNQAQDVWGDQLQSKLQCVVSIGTGVLNLKPVRDDVLGIWTTLTDLATETERTAQLFHRDKSNLDNEGRYYRFNVDHGLEEIGLEESKKKKEIAAATVRYIESQTVFKQMQACANNLAGRQYYGPYKTVFSLQGVPVSNHFVDRLSDTAELEQCLLPRRLRSRHMQRRKIFILYGLGGIGKTQLAADFARRHRDTFSSVFWLDGRSEDRLRQSLATCASRIPKGQIPDKSWKSAPSSEDALNMVVADVLDWLARPDNVDWLLIFDNVDQDHEQGGTTGAFDVRRYLPGDHGSALITTRLSRLARLAPPGNAKQLKKADKDLSKAIFEQWYGEELVMDGASKELLGLLDGLPLALAQAASYISETRLDVTSYVRLYKQQWDDLIMSDTEYGILYSDQGRLPEAEAMLQRALQGFEKALGPDHTSTLSTVGNLGRLYKDQGRLPEAEAMYQRALQGFETALGPDHTSTLDTANNLGSLYKDQGRLPEAETMLQRALQGKEKALGPDHTSTLDTVNNLGNLYCAQGRLPEAETMYQRALQGKEKALGPDHTSTLDTVGNLGSLYSDQGRLPAAEAMYQRALQGKEKALRPDHTSTLSTVGNLGRLYSDQGRLPEAETMLQRALQGSEKALGPDHTSTLDMVNNLGNLYCAQDRLPEAEAIYQRALQGFEKALGPDHISTLDTVNNLGNLYWAQDRLLEAEAMYQRALQGCEKVLGPDHTSTLDTVNNLGNLYWAQGRLLEAEDMYQRALQGKEKALGPNHTSTLDTVNNLGILYCAQDRLLEAEAMCQRALQGKEKALGPDHTSTLDMVNNLGNLYCAQGRLPEAETMYQRALRGKEKALGPDHTSTLNTVNNLGNLYKEQGRLSEAEAMFQRALQGKEKALSTT